MKESNLAIDFLGFPHDLKNQKMRRNEEIHDFRPPSLSLSK